MSAIALTDDGHLLIVIHEPGGTGASLYEFAEVLLTLRTASHGKVTWAINMDGGPGAHLYVPNVKRHCGSDTSKYLPNAVLAFH